MSHYSEGVRIEHLVLHADPVSHRIFAKVDIGDCWEWTGYRNDLGYGRIRLEGRGVLVHRAVWEMLVGPIAPGLELDHLCRIPACVNPDHLEPVTHQENVRRGITGSVNGARQRALTQCPRGHPYNEANTSHKSNTGYRVCRECARIRAAKRRTADADHVRALDRARYAANPEVFRERSRVVRARQKATT